MDSKDVKIVLGKALEIEAGKTYIVQNTGAAFWGDQINVMLKNLNESTGAKFIYISKELTIARESDGRL